MNIDALIWMSTVNITVTLFTGYFFYKVLFPKPQKQVSEDESKD